MYLDPRLWALTAGVRGRIAATVLVGLAAVAAGIARLALLGWLLGRVLAGDSLAALTPAIALTVLALAVRSALDYARTMVAHHTAFRVQATLREQRRVPRQAERQLECHGQHAVGLATPRRPVPRAVQELAPLDLARAQQIVDRPQQLGGGQPHGH